MFNNVQSTPEIFDPAQIQPGVVQKIRELGATRILKCNQCGKCAAVCPLVLTGFAFFNKRVIQSILIGFKDLILNDISIWACQSCNRCTEVCPTGADPFE
ncbi:MAG: 4Fe-4S dicluster domain-containing protein, partial [Bacillota bacterium]